MLCYLAYAIDFRPPIAFQRSKLYLLLDQVSLYRISIILTMTVLAIIVEKQEEPHQ